MEKAFKYRIYPNKKQQELIQKTFGCCRFVYNYFLDKRKSEYGKDKTSLSYNDTSKLLTKLKQELVWLKEPDKDSLQKSLKDLDMAYQKFFKEYAGYPKFKSKKNRYKSYRTSCTNNNISFQNKHIKLPKLGLIKIRDRQIPQGRILNATISQEPNGHYYCSLCCTDVDFPQYQKTNQNIGIDLGLVDFAIMSDGIKIENPRFYEKSEKKLVKLQRELSRKTIGSNRWNKARIKVANLQKHISNQRKDFLQKLTTDIIKKYDVICIEDLDVKSMKETDTSIRNKRVGDVSWSEFRRMLTYKSQWYGRTLSVVFKFEDVEYGKSLGSTEHHNRNGIAFKVKNDSVETTLKDIEFTMGKTGILTPTAVFEPVETEGSTVERAYISGITWSGGDPMFESNIETVLDITQKIKKQYPNKTIWLYTGYKFEQLIWPVITGDFNPERDKRLKQTRKLISLCDVIVDGRYKKELRDVSLHWCGSSNQRVIDVQKTLAQNKIILYEDNK